MKAVRVHESGGPEVLSIDEVPEPQPGPGEMRVRVIAAGVNPADWKMRERGGMPLPFIPGLDIAGMVDALGEGISEFRVGNEVFAKTMRGQGGYAEYTVINQSQAALKPRSIDFVAAAAIPTAGLTAWQALFDTADLRQGQMVLIHGVAGGVGSFAVQFAKWKGARVIGTASGSHIAFVKELGADEVIDYKNQRFEDIVHDVDVVLDTIGGETLERSWRVLKPGGFLVSVIGTIEEGAPEAHGVRAARITTRADGRELGEIASLVDAGQVKPFVTTVLPLFEARKAQEMSETHHVHGKIVLRIADESQPGEMAA